MRVCVPSRSILCFCSSSPTHCDCVCVLLFFLFFMCMTNLSYFFKQLIEQISHVHIKQSKQQHRRTQNISQSSTTAAERSTRALQSQTRQMQKKTTKSKRTKCKHNFWTCSDIICAQNYNKSTQTGAGATLLILLKTYTRTHSKRRREKRTDNNNWQSAMNKNENNRTIFNGFGTFFFQCFFCISLRAFASRLLIHHTNKCQQQR